MRFNVPVNNFKSNCSTCKGNLDIPIMYFKKKLIEAKKCLLYMFSNVYLGTRSFTTESGVGQVTCETSEIYLAGVSGGFVDVLSFVPHQLTGTSRMS